MPFNIELKDDETSFKKVEDAFDKVVKWLHGKKKFSPEILADDEPRELIRQTYDILSQPLHKLSIKQDIPAELTSALEQNIFIFSGFKTYHELKEASLLLKDENGGFKPFEKFARDVSKINTKYNRNYLMAEYNFATSSTQMAVKWKDMEADGDRYNLQYRTAPDSRVREEHAALHNTTLPIGDPFWDKYYPPNGWNCRCTAVQVRKDKYPESDSKKAMEAGEHATTKIGKDGSNKAAIFRFNPGKQEKIFPPKHPYLPKGCGNCKYRKDRNLSYNPDSEKCRACAIINKCFNDKQKTELARERTHYLHEMEPLLKKKVTVDGNGHPIKVGFNKYGNKHLYSDTYGRSSGLQKDDLRNLDKILENAVFVKKVGLSKERNDNIKRFYYYKTTLHGKTIYLNVAEEDFTNKHGNIWHTRFLYSVTDNLK